jgi:hypothetical protein
VGSLIVKGTLGITVASVGGLYEFLYNLFNYDVFISLISFMYYPPPPPRGGIEVFCKTINFIILHHLKIIRDIEFYLLPFLYLIPIENKSKYFKEV